MGLNLFEQYGLDPEAVHLFMVSLFSGTGMVCAAASAWILYNAMADWQTDFLYKPSLPFMLNIVLMLARVVYLMTVAVITNQDTSGGRCLFTGFMAQFFDTYFAFVLLAMLWSTTQDAISVMVEYPSNVVSKDHLDQLLRLSVGGALGVQLDKKKLKEGEIAPKVRRRGFNEHELLVISDVLMFLCLHGSCSHFIADSPCGRHFVR